VQIISEELHHFTQQAENALPSCPS